jgi:hypothetical protein
MVRANAVPPVGITISTVSGSRAIPDRAAGNGAGVTGKAVGDGGMNVNAVGITSHCGALTTCQRPSSRWIEQLSSAQTSSVASPARFS